MSDQTNAPDPDQPTEPPAPALSGANANRMRTLTEIGERVSLLVADNWSPEDTAALRAQFSDDTDPMDYLHTLGRQLHDLGWRFQK